MHSHTWNTADVWDHITWHLAHHTHATWSSHRVLDNWSVLSHVVLVFIHHILVSSLTRESASHLISRSHVSLVHELHLLLIHSTAHSLIEVTTTWELLVAKLLRRSLHHHLWLIWHLLSTRHACGWHCCYLWWSCNLRRLAGLTVWLG